MKALIFNNKVVDVQETEFEVAPIMTWVNCDNTVKIGFDYNGSTFISNEPTAEEITELQTEYDAKQYQRDRAIAYPSIQDQLDMQYWDKVNNTTNWKDAIAKVKEDNPK